MKYTRIGGMEVSQFALGTWHLPSSGTADVNGIYDVDREKTDRILKKAVDLGINLFDTANTYHGTISDTHLYPEYSGNAEIILGNYLRSLDRETYVVATKVRAEVARHPNGGGLSRKHILWQSRESLRRLGTGYIDLYQIHWEDPMTPHEETMDALNDLVHKGSINYIGISNHGAENVEDMIRISRERGWERFVSMQESYNLLDRRFEDGKASIASRHGMALLAYVPLAEGILTGKYRGGIPPGSRASYVTQMAGNIVKSQRIIDEVINAAAEIQAEPAQISLSWILRKQKDLGIAIIPILGATSPEHLEVNVESLEIKLPDEIYRRLESLTSR